MSSSNKKVLVSGCGFSWSGQTRKTWVNVLRAVGVTIIDVGGPAVSNQWIMNQTFLQLREIDSVDHVVLQLTSIGKLDVEVDALRKLELVDKDSIRNFVVNGVWPSSHSAEHESKRLYNQWLFSPGLETEDLFCKLLLLSDWCCTHGIPLTVLQAYDIPWTDSQRVALDTIIVNPADPLSDQYRRSVYYQHHDYTDQNTVPCVHYQIELAATVATIVAPLVLGRIQKMQLLYNKSDS